MKKKDEYKLGYEQGYFDGHLDLMIAIDKAAKEVFEQNKKRVRKK